MRFRLTDEQRQLQDEVRRITADPAAHRGLRAVVDGDEDFDRNQWLLLCAFGAPALIVPEAYGGAGLGLVELALVTEVLGHAATAVPMFGHVLATLAIARGGSDEQRTRLLPALAAGERLATIALGEADARWDIAEWTVTADGDRGNGTKVNVPHGMQADVAVVGVAGGGLAVVELDADGLERRDMGGLDRTRPLAALTFSDVAVEPLENGAAAAPHIRDAALTLLAADAFGGAIRCIEMANDYAKTREAFGVNVAQFQAVKHQLANMVLEAEPCRGLYWYAALSGAQDASDAAHVAALAKGQVSDVFTRVSRLAIELHGGIGFTWEYDAHIWMKRAMFDYAWGGNGDVQFARAAELAGW